jgi:hypothetical protein
MGHLGRRQPGVDLVADTGLADAGAPTDEECFVSCGHRADSSRRPFDRVLTAVTAHGVIPILICVIKNAAMGDSSIMWYRTLRACIPAMLALGLPFAGASSATAVVESKRSALTLNR